MKAARIALRTAVPLAGSGAGAGSVRSSRLPREVEQFSRFSPSPLSIKQLLDFGESTGAGGQPGSWGGGGLRLYLGVLMGCGRQQLMGWWMFSRSAAHVIKEESLGLFRGREQAVPESDYGAGSGELCCSRGTVGPNCLRRLESCFRRITASPFPSFKIGNAQVWSGLCLTVT